MRFATALFAVALSLTVAHAQAAPRVSGDGSLEISQVWARMSPKEADTTSVFFEVWSNGEESDELLSASSPVAGTIMLRRGSWKGLNFLNKDSDGIRIKPGTRTSFHPGAMEVTLTDLKAPVNVGSTLPVTLNFKEAGTITVEATVANQLLGNRGVRKN